MIVIALKHDDVKSVNKLLAQCIVGLIQGSPAILFKNTAAFVTLSNICVFTLLCHHVNFACLCESIAARNNMAEALVIFQESDIKGALLPEKVVLLSVRTSVILSTSLSSRTSVSPRSRIGTCTSESSGIKAFLAWTHKMNH